MHRRLALGMSLLLLLPSASSAAVHHYVFGLQSGMTYTVVQSGQTIASGLRPGASGEIQFGAPAASPIAIAPTGQIDGTPPAVVALAIGTVTPTSVQLAWNAPGDDGASGTATRYDIAYSTTGAITEGLFNEAVQATNEPAPAAAGTPQTFTVTGLASNTRYYFALRAVDEVGNASVSNSPDTTTPVPPDTTPPAAITSLSAPSSTSNSVQLRWTAPGDDGTNGTATTYDIRYSTTAITAGTFGSAQQATGEPQPSVAGTIQTMTIGSLTPSTTYYFAMTTADEVPNTSAISNVVSKATVAPPDGTRPGTVTDLVASSPTASSIDLTWTAPGDDGFVGTVASYEIRRAAVPLTSQNFGTGTIVTPPAPLAGGTQQTMTVTGLAPATVYYFALKARDEIDWGLVSNSDSSRTLPLVDLTPPSDIEDLTASGSGTTTLFIRWTSPGDDGASGTAARYEVRYATTPPAGGTWFDTATPVSPEPPAPAAGGTSQSMTITGLTPGTMYYIAMKTRDEALNWSGLSNVANGTTQDEPPPDLEAPGTVTDLAAGSPTATSVALSWTAPGDDGLTGTAAGYEIMRSGAPIDAQNWSDAEPLGAVPAPAPGGTPQTFTVGGLASDTVYYFALRARDEAGRWSEISNTDSTRTLAPPDGTAPARITVVSAQAISHDEIRVSWTATGDDGMTGTASSYDLRRSLSTINSSDWNAATRVTGVQAPSPAGTNESFIVGGLTPLTRYHFAIKAIDEAGNAPAPSPSVNALTLSPPAPGDTTDPAAVTDLSIVAGTLAPTGVRLRWTAPGDDGHVGRVQSYDVRRHGAPLTDDTFENGTGSENVPAPVDAPGQQAFDIMGLTPETDYWIALKARDDAGNWSRMSNLVSVTTPPVPDMTPPAAVTDLAAAAAAGEGSVLLTWTAPGDDGATGTAASYDARWRAASLSESTWPGAAPIPAEPAPAVAGTQQSLLVTGLTPGTTCAFAVKTTDEAELISALSNVAIAMVPVPADTTPPAAVADLRAVTVGTTAIALTWTSPADDGGACAELEIFVAAGPPPADTEPGWTLVEQAPLPAMPGVEQTFTVSALQPDSMYSFALRASDGANWSPRSNIVSERTAIPLDETPPAFVADLTVAAVTPASVELRWTAVGDDGADGQAAAYDLRRAASVIDASSWGAATPVVGLAAPAAAGIAESFFVEGLTPETTYHFALRVRDDSGNWSELSADVSATTPEAPDVTPPAPVVDLRTVDGSLARRGVTLRWTAPGDDGVEGQAYSYDLRSSEVPLTEAVWQTAEAVPDPPAPSVSGTVETIRVDHLSNGSTYYFRMRATDEAGNVSELSNMLVVVTPNPGRIRDLAASPAPGAVVFSWRWPEGDAFCGPPAIFEARISDAPIDETTWPTAERIGLDGVEMTPGGEVNWSATGLLPGESRSLALRVAFEEGCLSEITAATGFAGSESDINAPPSIADLAGLAASDECVTVSWTAPFDDEESEPVRSYDLRYAETTITEQSFASASRVETGAPGTPGVAEALTVCGLEPETTYHFALLTLDEAGNASGLSNVVAVTTAAGPDVSPPSAPIAPHAECDGGTVTVEWTQNIEPDVTSYTVQRSIVLPQAAGNFERSVPHPPFTDEGLEPGVTVRYLIFAVDAAGNRSAASAPVEIEVCSSEAAPASFRLLDPWPNPFTTSVEIPFEVPSDRSGRSCRLLLFDTAGNAVRVLETVPSMPGRYAFTWDGLNDQGRVSAPGLYIARLAGCSKGAFIVKRR